MNFCSRCGKRPEPSDETWPGRDGVEICQLCWEAECDDAWWEYLEYLEDQRIA